MSQVIASSPKQLEVRNILLIFAKLIALHEAMELCHLPYQFSRVEYIQAWLAYALEDFMDRDEVDLMDDFDEIRCDTQALTFDTHFYNQVHLVIALKSNCYSQVTGE